MPISKPLPEELPSLGKLWFSVVCAVLIAAALLLAVILPAERGIDLTGIGKRLQLTRIGIIKTAMRQPEAPATGRPAQEDELSITLDEGEGREIKMDMKKGYTVEYSWTATGGPVNHDTHGDIYDNEDIYISYSKADSVESDNGTITAPFSGNHGWYWKNKSDLVIDITLKTKGEYVDIAVK